MLGQKAAAAAGGSAAAAAAAAGPPPQQQLRVLRAAMLGLLAATVGLAVWGFVQSMVLSYAVGSTAGNNYTATWICGLALLLAAQAGGVLLRPRLVTARAARRRAWLGFYVPWMLAACLVLLISMGLLPPSRGSLAYVRDQLVWALLWLPPLCVIAAAAATHARCQLATIAGAPAAAAAAAAAADVEAAAAAAPSAAQQQRPPACSRAAWRTCWHSFWAFVGWSSLFWGAVLAFFLALQAVWLTHDAIAFPPLGGGNLHTVTLTDAGGSKAYTARIHMACVGPRSSAGLSTFVLEAGGGAPGVMYAALADELAAAGRRACYYDRLGYGWSDAAWLFPAVDQDTRALHQALSAAGEAGPFVLAGHSAGGQMALLYAVRHPVDVSGVALLDSYDDVAIALAYGGASSAADSLVNVSLPLSGRSIQRPAISDFNAALASVLDVLRAVTPLGWGRFITMKGPGSRYPYQGAANAAYGNNQEWHAQWVAVKSGAAGVTPPTSDQLADLAGRPGVWHGTAWPDLSPRPVLLLPAAATLAGGGAGATIGGLPPGASCDVASLPANASCQAAVAACDAKACTYADLYVSYLRTLSSNASMIVMPGGHDFPWSDYEATAAALLTKFAGV